MPTLQVIAKYTFKGISVPTAECRIDWVSFDRVDKTAEFVIGVYKDSTDADSRQNRLDAHHIRYANEQYDDLIANHPDVFVEIVEEVSLIAAVELADIVEYV